MNYQSCLQSAHQKQNLKLCPRGYCTAKNKFEVYPSAYANGYAVQVCRGTKPDLKGIIRDDYNKPDQKTNETSLRRWFQEEWVNVCESGDGPGGYKRCGSGQGLSNPDKYPYCRPYHKLPGTKLVTAPEMTESEIKHMCHQKRKAQRKHTGKKPTRVVLPETIRQRGGGNTVKIPREVQLAAKLGLALIELGYKGGTPTGWARAKQLTGQTIDLKSLADMRTWFARHGPDSSNGGTSYQGYSTWMRDGQPINLKEKNKRRGVVSWLIWGGDSAYLWLKQPDVREALKRQFPARKEASIEDRLSSYQHQVI